MKTKLLTKTVLGLAFALALLIPAATKASSTVTFDNQSGKSALVKLVGPTTSSVFVENNNRQSVPIAPGHYFIKVRYGTPGGYSYSKGDEFDVKETTTTASDITITLHKVVAGNYGSKIISETEFGASTTNKSSGDDKEGNHTRGDTAKVKSPEQSTQTKVIVLHTNLLFLDVMFVNTGKEDGDNPTIDMAPAIIGGLVDAGFTIHLSRDFVRRNLAEIGTWKPVQWSNELKEFLQACLAAGTLRPPGKSTDSASWSFVSDPKVDLAPKLPESCRLNVQVSWDRKKTYYGTRFPGLEQSVRLPTLNITLSEGSQSTEIVTFDPPAPDSAASFGSVHTESARSVRNFIKGSFRP
jgi:hypothetical protein